MTTTSYTTIMNIPYGDDPCQFVNAYIPTADIKGVVLRVHGGGWASGNVAPWPSPTNTDPAMTPVAEAGYVLVDVNYRGVNNSDGSNGNGQMPYNVDDIISVLKYCTVPEIGKSENWQTLQSLISLKGFIVVGISAGAHLTIMGVCTYGMESGIWPLAAVGAAGPYNLDYNSVFIEKVIQPVLDNCCGSNGLKESSPHFLYGTAEAPGPWFEVVNMSNCKFHFIHNDNDTIVPDNMARDTILNFLKFNNNTTVEFVNQGPPKGAFPGTTDAVWKNSPPGMTLNDLPVTGNVIGDAWQISGLTWLYNEGTFAGDSINPASVKGFTRWFDHNYSRPETAGLLEVSDMFFAVKKRKKFLEKLKNAINKFWNSLKDIF